LQLGEVQPLDKTKEVKPKKGRNSQTRILSQLLQLLELLILSEVQPEVVCHPEEEEVEEVWAVELHQDLQHQWYSQLHPHLGRTQWVKRHRFRLHLLMLYLNRKK
jgi:hypothetical protein